MGNVVYIYIRLKLKLLNHLHNNFEMFKNASINIVKNLINKRQESQL